MFEMGREQLSEDQFRGLDGVFPDIDTFIASLQTNSGRLKGLFLQQAQAR